MERRKYQRITIKSVATIDLFTHQRRSFAFIGCVSRGGLELYCQESLALAEPVSIVLSFLSRQGDESQDTLEGTIRWCSKLGEAYMAGVEFTTPIVESEHPALWLYLSDQIMTAE